MDEHKLQDIWKKNLREFNDVMRLDSIIIRAMQEAIKEAQTEQLILSGVSESTSPNAPEKIYLNIGFDKDVLDIKDIDFEELIGVTWSKDKLSDNDILYSR